MSILYDEGQQAIATESRRVLDARTSKDRLLKLLETTGEFDAPFWDTAVEQGWTALAIPEEHGGLGLSLVELGLVAQATGAATAGAPFLTIGYGASHALAAAGATDWLPNSRRARRSPRLRWPRAIRRCRPLRR
jgi:acyl-CoA dehydrogenase